MTCQTRIIARYALLAAAALLVLALIVTLRPAREERRPPPLPPGGLSAIEVPPPLHRELEDVLALAKPGADRFALEAVHEEIRRRLQILEPFLRAPPRDESDLEKRFGGIGEVVSEDAKTAPLAPASERTIHGGAGIEAFAGEAAGDAATAGRPAGGEERKGPLGMAEEVRRLIQPLSALESAVLEVTRIDGAPEGPLDTEILYQLSGTGEDGTRRMWTGRWEVAWAPGPKIAGLRPVEAARAVLAAPPFEDRSASALGGNPSYAAQLRPGLDFFRDRIDGASGIDVDGFQGIAVGDADGDGLEDIYLPEPPGLPGLLFRNLGDGTFEDISSGSGADLLDGVSQALFLDLEDDGDQDLFLVLPDRVAVLKNDGRGRFEPRPTGLEKLAAGGTALLCAAAADYDRDGAVDVFVGSTAVWKGPSRGLGSRPPFPYLDARDGGRGFILKNRGDGTFRDVTREAGLAEGNDRSTFAAAWGDIDDDGYPDLCAGGPNGPKRLFHNQRNGTFLEIAARAGAAEPAGGTSAAWGDFDGDGRLDLFFAGARTAAGLRIAASPDFRPEDPSRAGFLGHARGNTLLRNRGDGTFADATLPARTQGSGWAWAGDFIDFDLDGREDLFIACGFVTNEGPGDLAGFFWRQVVSQSPDRPVPRKRYALSWEALQRSIREDGSLGARERNRLFLGCDGGAFVDVSAASGVDFQDDGRAFAVMDFDGDGRPDIILRSRRGPRLRVLENRSRSENRSVWFHLTGASGNRDALGARIEILTDRGPRVKAVDAGSAFLSHHSRWIAFGLGKEGTIQSVRIRWPGGQVQELAGISPGMRYRVVEGKQPAGEPFGSAASPPEGEAASPGSPREAPEPPQASPLARVWLLDPLPAPVLKLSDLSGRKQGILDSGEPLILLFLSPECGASVKEAADLREGLEEIRGAGGRVIVVAIAKAGHEGEVRERFGDVPFPVLLADRETLTVWNVVHRSLFNRPRNLATPAAFLIGGEGRIEKVYRGLTDPKEFAADIRRLPVPEGARLSLALPFPGTLLGPPFRRDLLSLGVLLDEAGAPRAAIPVLERVIEGDSRRVEALLCLGLVLEDAGDREAAEKAYREALSIEPENAEALDSLGLLLLRAGDIKASRELFLKALKAGLVDSALHLGETYLREARPDGAAKIFQEALRLDPGWPALWCSLGFSLFKEGQAGEGIAAFEKAFQLSPADPEAADGLTNLLLERGLSADLDRAREVIEKAALFHPGDLRVLNELGRVRAIFEEFEGAEEAYRTAITADRENEIAYLNLARLLLKKKDSDGAAEVLRNLIRIQPKNSRAKEMLSGIPR